jgi:hypothetical protein
MRDAARKIQLRQEISGQDRRSLWAYCDEEGNLQVDGQDLGPGTALVSSDGEYEWSESVKAADIPRLVELLGGAPGEDILRLLERRFCGVASYEFEGTLRESGLPVKTWVWSG